MLKLPEKQKTKAVENFKKYLQIPSVHPDVNYDECVKFIKKLAEDLDLPVAVYGLTNKPVVVITWNGLEPNLPAVMLNSHMDVVPVYEDQWTHPPFAAQVDDEGNIHARGSQDCKCLGIQYLEAIRLLKNSGKRLKRTIHVTFVPDEEISGELGMKIFVESKEFQNLNVGFALDEGAAQPEETFAVFYGERIVWCLTVHCPGTTGHGSLLLENTAGEKIRHVLNKFLDYREKEKKLLEENQNFLLGDVTTINLTQINGGVQENVIPAELSVSFDVRITPTLDVNEFETMIKGWCQESGKDIWCEFTKLNPPVKSTCIDDSNPWWVAFSKSLENMSLKILPQICPGGTDSRRLRALGIPALGFSPMNHTPILLHCNNEYLNVDVFLRGIEIYTSIITAVASV